jgi:hypothetical protein
MHGYEYVCTIAGADGKGIEDWWVDPKFVDREFAVRVAEQIFK